jgi:glycosyltransferase involved in cell wall biosynthesis
MQAAIDGLGLPTVFVPNPAPPVAASVAARAPRGDELHWVFAGRIEPEKGLRPFLDAVPADFPGRMTIVGDGSHRAACEAACARRGLADRVVFTGSVARAEAQVIIASAHVVVLPSVTPENAPLTLIEAIALGASVLASDRGGMPEIVETSGVGSVYDVQREDDLARAVARIARRHAEGSLLGFDAQPFLEARSERAYTDAIMQAYESV